MGDVQGGSGIGPKGMGNGLKDGKKILSLLPLLVHGVVGMEKKICPEINFQILQSVTGIAFIWIEHKRVRNKGIEYPFNNWSPIA
jgi:hypothetical protein